MRKFFTAALLLCSLISQAQTFSWSGYSPIVSNVMDTLRINVSGLPTSIDLNFGLSKVCFEARHSNKTNLNMVLVAPNGNSVILVEGQGAIGENFIGTCVAMDGVPWQAGTPPFTGTFLPTGNLSNFNSGIDPNGEWLMVTFDNTPDTGSLRFASITFSTDPPQGNGMGGNNLGPQGPFIQAGLVCPGGASGCELLPDMTASALEIQTSMVETPGRIEVGNSTPNIGYGPLEIFGIDSCFCNGVPQPCGVPCPAGQNLTHIIRQRIYRKIPGTDTLGFVDRDAGLMTFHPEHGHLHVDHWADFTLRTATADPDPRNWPIVGTSVKQSYCLINLASCPNRAGICVDNDGNNITNFPNYGFGFQSGCGLYQGIFPGKYDIYARGLNEPILLDNVCNGTYYIVSITDPNNIFLESDETNNVAVVPITLTQQNTKPVITGNFRLSCSEGENVILTASTPNPSQYLWSTGETTASIVATRPNNYSVTTGCGVASENLSLSPSPSISIIPIEGSIPTCVGSILRLTTSPSYKSDEINYEWQINGVDAGTNNDTLTLFATGDSMKISCRITSTLPCPEPVFLSDSIKIQVYDGDDFDASITQTKGYNPFCIGDTVTFKANVLTGLLPIYHWKVDGVDAGFNSPEFTSISLQDGQKVTCTVSGISSCSRINATIGASEGLNEIQSIVPAAYPTWYGNGRQQYLIQANELLANGLTAGPITKISFVTGSNVGQPAILKNYTIKLANVANVALTNTLLSPLSTNVYGPVDYSPTINDTNTHNFTAPFYWDGVSNLLVDICFSNQVVGNGNYQTTFTSTSFVSSAMFAADNAQAISTCIRTTANATSSTRPVMYFTQGTTRDINSNPITLEKLEPIYRFTGNGNWDIPSNWLNSKMPPKHVLHCAEIIIDPAGNGECILNTAQVVAPGAKITVMAGKKFTVIGNVLVQE